MAESILDSHESFLPGSLRAVGGVAVALAAVKYLEPSFRMMAQHVQKYRNKPNQSVSEGIHE